MKAINIFVAAIASLIFIWISPSCDSDTYGDISLVILPQYIIQCPDTTVSASAQQLEFYISGTYYPSIEIPADFQVVVSNLWNQSWELDGGPLGVDPSKCPDNQNPDKPGIKIPTRWDWIDVRYLKQEDGPTKVIVNLPENNTGQERGIRIGFFKEVRKNNWYCAETFIYQKAKVDTTPFEMKVRYRGESFISTVHLDENEEYVYHDPEFETLMQRLSNNPNINMLVMDDVIVDYFDVDDPVGQGIFKKLDSTLEPGLESIRADLQSEDLKVTRANGFEDMTDGCLSYFAVFDNDAYKGSNKITKEVTDFYNMYNLPNLKGFGINDRITSLAVGYFGDNPNVCSVLTLWEDVDYNHGDLTRSKHRISFVASYYNRMINRSNLKDIKCLNSSSSWNDRASALSCHFGYFDSSLLDY